MRVANGGQPPANRGYLRSTVRLSGQKGGNGLGIGRESRDALGLAPAAE